MAKLSVARINYIIANINDFEPLTYINMKKGDAPEVITPTREMVCNILGACTFFRKIGHESAMLNVDNTVVTIEIFSQSQDKTIWSNHTIYLKTTANTCFNLGI